MFGISTNNLNNLELLETDIINKKDENGFTPLIHAIYTGDVQIIKELLENGADINIKDDNKNSPIIHGIYKYYKLYNAKTPKYYEYCCKTINILLKYGANIDDIDDNEKCKLLCESIKNKNAHLINILVKHNKNKINKKTNITKKFIFF